MPPPECILECPNYLSHKGVPTIGLVGLVAFNIILRYAVIIFDKSIMPGLTVYSVRVDPMSVVYVHILTTSSEPVSSKERKLLDG